MKHRPDGCDASNRNTQLKDTLILHTIRAVADWLGLEKVPNCVTLANPQIFEHTTVEITAFLVFYAAKHEAAGVVDNQAVINEFRRLTGCVASYRYLSFIVSSVFYKQVLSKRRFDPPREAIGRRVGKAMSSKQKAFCEAYKQNGDIEESLRIAGYSKSSFKTLACSFKKHPNIQGYLSQCGAQMQQS